MQRLTEIVRFTKCALGVLLIVSFFLPWVAQTPSCLDKSVVIRDNITGLELVREGTATEALAAPAFGAAVAALALILRGRVVPLARSLVSIIEIPAGLVLFALIDLSLRLFTPFVVRYGYMAAVGIFWTIPFLSLSEVIILFGRLRKAGKIIIVSTGILVIILAFIDRLSDLFR